jgi:hypothetical protein
MPADKMSDHVKLLFICENWEAAPAFLKHLERGGCRVIFARNTEFAAKTLLSACEVDAILIQHDSLMRGSTIGCGLKLISPLLPVLLLTAQWPSNGTLPIGIDVLCCAHTLGRRAAHDIMKFVHYLMADVRNQGLDNRFVSQKPLYLN